MTSQSRRWLGAAALVGAVLADTGFPAGQQGAHLGQLAGVMAGQEQVGGHGSDDSACYHRAFGA
jgi:hypothetical protein